MCRVGIARLQLPLWHQWPGRPMVTSIGFQSPVVGLMIPGPLLHFRVQWHPLFARAPRRLRGRCLPAFTTDKAWSSGLAHVFCTVAELLTPQLEEVQAQGNEHSVTASTENSFGCGLFLMREIDLNWTGHELRMGLEQSILSINTFVRVLAHQWIPVAAASSWRPQWARKVHRQALGG